MLSSTDPVSTLTIKRPTEENLIRDDTTQARFSVRLVVRLTTARKMHGSVIGNRILGSHQKSALNCFSVQY